MESGESGQASCINCFKCDAGCAASRSSKFDNAVGYASGPIEKKKVAALAFYVAFRNAKSLYSFQRLGSEAPGFGHVKFISPASYLGSRVAT